MDDLDDDMRLALRLLNDASEDTLLLLPCALDCALAELKDRRLADITEVGGGIPLASITRRGREVYAAASKETT
jgi:hypothetical protein